MDELSELDEQDVIVLIRQNIERVGSLRALAREWGVSPALLCGVAKRRRRPGPKVIKPLGLEKIVRPVGFSVSGNGKGMTNPKTWCEPGHTAGHLYRPITEDWLRDNGFRIESGRNDPRFPIRSLAVAGYRIGGRGFMGSSDDLCIDVAPGTVSQDEWMVWIGQREPYRHIHVRNMKETWEIARLYEGLTGRVWPGNL